MNDAGGSEENKGIGEEHVNTMGFAAEGGGFNATKAGVGKEAGRK